MVKDPFCEMQSHIHRVAIEHGWWEDYPVRSFGDLIALCHSELSEALEEFRKNGQPNFTWSQGDKPEGVPIELADCVIRIMDMCEYYGIDLHSAISIKMQYNETRPFRHGGKAM